MSGFLRFVGIFNAVVWCGAAFFVIIGVPALFSPEMKTALSVYGTGLAAEAVLARYFILQYVCATIAVLHVLGEWIYFGRPLWRFNLGLVLWLLAMSLLGGLWMQPKLRGLHITKYFGATAEEKTQADETFKKWHGASEAANLLVIFGLVVYVYKMTGPTESPRFVSFGKIRS